MVSKTFNIWRDLFRNIDKKLKIDFYFVTFLMIISGLSECFSIASIVPFIKIINNPELIPEINLINLSKYSSNNLTLLCGLVFIISAIFSGLLRTYTLKKSCILSAKIAEKWSTKIYKILIKTGYEKLILFKSSEYINLIITELNQTLSVVSQTFTFLSNSIISFFIFTTLFLVNPLSVLLSLIFFIFIYSVFMLYNKRKLSDLSYKIVDSTDYQIKFVQETFGSIRDLKISNLEDQFINSYYKNDILLRYSDAQARFIKSYPRFIVEVLVLVFVSLLLIIFKVGLKVELDIAYLSMFALGIQKVLPTLQNSYLTWSSLKSNSKSVDDILSKLNETVEDNINSVKPLIFKKSISLKNIFYKYPESDKKILKNINLTIKKGERIGITGKTGVGKSTIVDLITGLLTPQEGHLIVDDAIIDKNKNITYWKSWLKAISYVSQNYYLSDTSIEKNIAFGIDKINIDKKRLKKACQISESLEFINDLPYKFHEIIGERGIKLSGGQRQRIALARALYKLESILIMDEASSALDKLTEKSILENISKLDNSLTIIIVSHKQEMLDLCNKVYRIENNTLKLTRG